MRTLDGRWGDGRGSDARRSDAERSSSDRAGGRHGFSGQARDGESRVLRWPRGRLKRRLDKGRRDPRAPSTVAVRWELSRRRRPGARQDGAEPGNTAQRMAGAAAVDPAPRDIDEAGCRDHPPQVGESHIATCRHSRGGELTRYGLVSPARRAVGLTRCWLDDRSGPFARSGHSGRSTETLAQDRFQRRPLPHPAAPTRPSTPPLLRPPQPHPTTPAWEPYPSEASISSARSTNSAEPM